MKPTVFNYQEYERVVEENKKLNAEVADLRIRIADGDKRDCKSCKHQKADGCSRWNCEYEPRMDGLISRADAIDTVEELNRKVNDGRENDTICTSDVLRRINALPSATMDKEHLIDLIQEAVYDGEACAKLIDLVDRPTGEWVRKYDKQINCYWYECNQCGEYRPRNVLGKEWSSPYCPNCGAIMYKGGGSDG